MFNVIRPPLAPVSLAKQQSYAEVDVLLQLKAIFHDKCYLCETKKPQDINVEHFRPHQGDAHLKFDWQNLFYACSRCNNIKSNHFGQILDCSDVNTDVFRKIKLLPPRSPNALLVHVEAVDDDPATIETVQLLEKIYNDPNTANKQITAAYLRNEIFKVYRRFSDLMVEYFSHESTERVKQDALEKMQMYMKKSQAYSAFLRWVVLGDADLPPLLEQHMD